MTNISILEIFSYCLPIMKLFQSVPPFQSPLSRNEIRIEKSPVFDEIKPYEFKGIFPEFLCGDSTNFFQGIFCGPPRNV